MTNQSRIVRPVLNDDCGRRLCSKGIQRIEVDAILDDPDFNKPYIELKSVKANKNRITAKLMIDVDTKNGPRRKTVECLCRRGIR